MIRTTLRFTMLLTWMAGSLSATLFSTLPTSGVLTGAPGQDVGWGFSTTNDSLVESISFSQSVLINETNPTLGFYTDLIGPQGGPDNFSVDPGQTWSEAFSEVDQAGLGLFSIDPNAVPGSSDSGSIRVFYNFADSTPGSFDVPFFVFVQAVPEPGAGWLFMIGAALLLGWRRNSATERISIIINDLRISTLSLAPNSVDFLRVLGATPAKSVRYTP